METIFELIRLTDVKTEKNHALLKFNTVPKAL